ncbi:MAG TPA: ABC transporter permease [Vicinamibacterales bacterium]|nr:ABC transporter permease [Vicinamibacterales bacterium]
MRALRYFFDEAAASLWRGYGTGVIATATIVTAFVVLGGFLILTTNLERAFTRWQGAAEFSVYLNDNATPAQQTAVEKALRDSRLVAGVEVVSKAQALVRFKENFSALAEAAADLPSNPLPASVEVRLRSGADPARVELLAGAMAKSPGVADVRYDRRWIQRLMQAVGVVRAGGFALAALLVFAAALTVASVVRLALFARREEIHIMQLVGAPIAYIKGPFIVEGLIQGGVGAMLALIFLWLAFLTLKSRADAWLGGAIEPATLVFLSWPTSAALLAAGMAVGSLGGLIAARSTREINT